MITTIIVIIKGFVLNDRTKTVSQCLPDFAPAPALKQTQIPRAQSRPQSCCTPTSLLLLSPPPSPPHFAHNQLREFRSFERGERRGRLPTPRFTENRQGEYYRTLYITLYIIPNSDSKKFVKSLFVFRIYVYIYLYYRQSVEYRHFIEFQVRFVNVFNFNTYCFK